MVKFYYGSKEDFRDCSDAVRLSDDEVQRLVDDVTKTLLDKIKRNDENNSTFCGTGDTMVFGFVFDEDGDNELDTINIFVCRNYEEAEAWFTKNYRDFEKMNWEKDYEMEEYDAEVAELERYSKDDLIKMVMKSKYADYNPHKEV